MRNVFFYFNGGTSVVKNSYLLFCPSNLISFEGGGVVSVFVVSQKPHVVLCPTFVFKMYTLLSRQLFHMITGR